MRCSSRLGFCFSFFFLDLICFIVFSSDSFDQMENVGCSFSFFSLLVLSFVRLIVIQSDALKAQVQTLRYVLGNGFDITCTEICRHVYTYIKSLLPWLSKVLSQGSTSLSLLLI